MVDCPRCGRDAKATGKEWDFGQFKAKQFKCAPCGLKFGAYFKGGKLSHTVPKS